MELVNIAGAPHGLDQATTRLPPIRAQGLVALEGTTAFNHHDYNLVKDLANFQSMSRSTSTQPSMFARRPSRGMTGGAIGRQMTGGFGVGRQITGGFGVIGVGWQMTGSTPLRRQATGQATGGVSRQGRQPTADTIDELDPRLDLDISERTEGLLGEDIVERYVSLVAHNDMKPTMMLFVASHLEFFRQRQIITTSSTGKALEEKLGLEVACKVSSGPLGGDQEIGALISQGHVAAVFFFRDPLSAHPHESDIQALVRICDVHNIMTASNTVTGSAVIHALQESIEHREHLSMSPADVSLTDSEVVTAYKAKQKLAIANAVAGSATSQNTPEIGYR